MSLQALRELTDDPFLRWSVPDAGFLGAWRLGDSFALARSRGPRMVMPAPWLLLLGGKAELAELVDQVPDLVGSVPGAVTVSAPAYPLLPTEWGLRVRGRWDYMMTSSPPAVTHDVPVHEVHDEAAISDLLNAENADAHARPGNALIHSWLGVSDDLGLACVGALIVTENGGAHLRAVTTAQRARRLGLGSAVSAALTARGLSEVSPEVTLGVYSDNAPALAMYTGLGFSRIHRLVSSVSTAHSSTATAP